MSGGSSSSSSLPFRFGGWEALAVPDLREYLRKSPKKTTQASTSAASASRPPDVSSAHQQPPYAPPTPTSLLSSRRSSRSASPGVRPARLQPDSPSSTVGGGGSSGEGDLSPLYGSGIKTGKKFFSSQQELLLAAGAASATSGEQRTPTRRGAGRGEVVVETTLTRRRKLFHPAIVGIVNEDAHPTSVRSKLWRARLLLRYWMPSAGVRRGVYTVVLALLVLVVYDYQDVGAVIGELATWAESKYDELVAWVAATGWLATLVVLPTSDRVKALAFLLPNWLAVQIQRGVVFLNLLHHHAGERVDPAATRALASGILASFVALLVFCFVRKDGHRTVWRYGQAWWRRADLTRGPTSTTGSSNSSSSEADIDSRLKFVSRILLYWLETSVYLEKRTGRCRRRFSRRVCFCHSCRKRPYVEPDPFFISPQENLTLLTILHDKLLKIVEVFIFDLLCAQSDFVKNVQGMREVLEGAKNALYSSYSQLQQQQLLQQDGRVEGAAGDGSSTIGGMLNGRKPPSVRQFLETAYSFVESIREQFGPGSNTGGNEGSSSDDEVDFYYEVSSEEEMVEEPQVGEEGVVARPGETESGAALQLRRRRRNSSVAGVGGDNRGPSEQGPEKMEGVQNVDTARKALKPLPTARLRSNSKMKDEAAASRDARATSASAAASAKSKIAKLRRSELHPILFVGPCMGARLVKDARPANGSTDSPDACFWWQKRPQHPSKKRKVTAKEWLLLHRNSTDRWLESLTPSEAEKEAIRSEEVIWNRGTVLDPRSYRWVMDSFAFQWKEDPISGSGPGGSVVGAPGKGDSASRGGSLQRGFDTVLDENYASQQTLASCAASSVESMAAVCAEDETETGEDVAARSRRPSSRVLQGSAASAPSKENEQHTHDSWLPPSYRLHDAKSFTLDEDANRSGCSALRNILPFREVSPAEGYAVPWNVLMFANLMRSGYTRRRCGNLFYDWRKSALEWERDGTFEQAKLTLELYRAKFGKPCVLISWSQGGRFVHSFMDWLERTSEASLDDTELICSQYVDLRVGKSTKSLRTTQQLDAAADPEHEESPTQQDEDVPSRAQRTKSSPSSLPSGRRSLNQLYKDLHIKHWVSIAAPFAGAPNALLSTLMPHPGANYYLGNVIPWIRDVDLRNVSCTWPGVAYLLPQPGSLPPKSDVVVRDALGRVHCRFESVIVAQKRHFPELTVPDYNDYLVTSGEEEGGVVVQEEEGARAGGDQNNEGGAGCEEEEGDKEEDRSCSSSSSSGSSSGSGHRNKAAQTRSKGKPTDGSSCGHRSDLIVTEGEEVRALFECADVPAIFLNAANRWRELTEQAERRWRRRHVDYGHSIRESAAALNFPTNITTNNKVAFSSASFAGEAGSSASTNKHCAAPGSTTSSLLAPPGRGDGSCTPEQQADADFSPASPSKVKVPSSFLARVLDSLLSCRRRSSSKPLPRSPSPENDSLDQAAQEQLLEDDEDEAAAAEDPDLVEFCRCREAMQMSELMACMSKRMEEKQAFRNLRPPHIACTALIGTKIQTGYQYRYDNGVENFPSKILYTHGDGTVPFESLTMCKYWARDFYREKYLFSYADPDAHLKGFRKKKTPTFDEYRKCLNADNLPFFGVGEQVDHGEKKDEYVRRRMEELKMEKPVDVIVMEGVGHMDTLYSKMTADAVAEVLAGVNGGCEGEAESSAKIGSRKTSRSPFGDVDVGGGTGSWRKKKYKD